MIQIVDLAELLLRQFSRLKLKPPVPRDSELWSSSASCCLLISWLSDGENVHLPQSTLSLVGVMQPCGSQHWQPTSLSHFPLTYVNPWLRLQSNPLMFTFSLTYIGRQRSIDKGKGTRSKAYRSNSIMAYITMSVIHIQIRGYSNSEAAQGSGPL